ncbi:Hypothetical predicted protein [Octopus vulgaris]|uniref:Uncharacterized protein n=1 Tax=Octopus vulgaris TaxID=6645 RepID=A0AA36EVX0_OCTVU|nr:Hypothetical predicted protein [Octopus vulgaris]
MCVSSHERSVEFNKSTGNNKIRSTNLLGNFEQGHVLNGSKIIREKISATYGNYSITKKQAIAIVNKCKEEYDSVLEGIEEKTHWDAKRKRHVPDTPKQGYLAKAARLSHLNLAGVKTSDRLFDYAVKVAKHCYEKYLKGELDSAEKNPKKRFRVAGGGRETKVPGVRDTSFEWLSCKHIAMQVFHDNHLMLEDFDKSF